MQQLISQVYAAEQATYSWLGWGAETDVPLVYAYLVGSKSDEPMEERLARLDEHTLTCLRDYLRALITTYRSDARNLDNQIAMRLSKHVH